MHGYHSFCRSRYLSSALNWIYLKSYYFFCCCCNNDNTINKNTQWIADELPEEKQIIIELINEYDD